MKKLHVAWIAGLVFAVCAPGFARGPFYPESTGAKKSRKFARGFLNATMWWAEIPKEVNRDWRNVDPMTGVFSGTCKGIYKGSQRFGAGVYEMVTYRRDQPANYQPIVYPETVMEDGYDWGADEYYSQQRWSKVY